MTVQLLSAIALVVYIEIIEREGANDVTGVFDGLTGVQ